MKRRARYSLVLTVLCLITGHAYPADEPWKAYFGPTAATKKTGLYYNLIRFIDSAETSLYGSIHELDFVAIAERFAAKAEAGVEVVLVFEERWWESQKTLASRAALEASSVRIVLDSKKSGLMHNKFLIADHQRVWTGSANFTSTGLFYNPNSGLWLEDPKIAANFISEFEEMLEGRFGKLASGASNTPYPKLRFGNRILWTDFSPEDNPLAPMIRAIDAAQRDIAVACFVFSSQPIAEALLRAHERGIRVRVLLDDQYQSPAATARWGYVPYDRLVEAGVTVHYDAFPSKVHHKFVIIDQLLTITGSFNLSDNAVNNNDENVVFILDRDLALVFHGEFERLWQENVTAFTDTVVP